MKKGAQTRNNKRHFPIIMVNEDYKISQKCEEPLYSLCHTRINSITNYKITNKKLIQFINSHWRTAILWASPSTSSSAPSFIIIRTSKLQKTILYKSHFKLWTRITEKLKFIHQTMMHHETWPHRTTQNPPWFTFSLIIANIYRIISLY